MRSLAVAFAAILAGSVIDAAAQVRTIPADAKPGKMSHVQEMLVDIDGKPQELARGAQIRDASNRLIVPAALPKESLVKYRLDGEGRVRQTWILTPEEAAQK